MHILWIKASKMVWKRPAGGGEVAWVDSVGREATETGYIYASEMNLNLSSEEKRTKPLPLMKAATKTKRSEKCFVDFQTKVRSNSNCDPGSWITNSSDVYQYPLTHWHLQEMNMQTGSVLWEKFIEVYVNGASNHIICPSTSAPLAPAQTGGKKEKPGELRPRWYKDAMRTEGMFMKYGSTSIDIEIEFHE